MNRLLLLLLLFTFPGRYVAFSGNSASWHYYVQDYHGNNRMVVNGSGSVEQVTHYYPYGGVIGNISTNGDTQKYKFLGKELDRKFGLDWYDDEARMYDAIGVPRFTSIDPLAEKYYHLSPYSYCGGDPVNRVDPTGNVIETLWDIANVGIDIYNLGSNILNGKWKDASLDAGALLLDFSAAVIPFVPGGAGVGLKTTRITDKAIDALRATDKGSDIEHTLDKISEVGKAQDNFKININSNDKIDRSLLDNPSKPGNTPTFKSDGTPVEIHHVGQNPKGPFKEMHMKEHRGKGNFKQNHSNNNRLTPQERKELNRAKKVYWKNEYKND